MRKIQFLPLSVVTIFLICFGSSVYAQRTKTEYTERTRTEYAERLKSEYSEYYFHEDEISAIDWNLEQLQTELNIKYKPNCEKGTFYSLAISEKEYEDRLAKLPTVIGLPYNKIVRQYIDVYLSGNRREKVEKILGLSSRYFPMFEDALEANDMPLELKYLPVIESALNYRAYSRAGASGLWQFMVGTGKLYGLTINTLVDERRDPFKSTHAGVKYLKDLYKIYNDWHLAIAAYNCGPGNVNKAIQRSGGKRNYWDIYYFLPKETRGYVPAFIAATYLMNYYQQHNLCPTEPENIPLLRDTVYVKERLNLQQVAEMLSIPVEDLRAINPQYRKDILPGDRLTGYSLCLPHNKVLPFIKNKNDILIYKSNELTERKDSYAEPAGKVQKNAPAQSGKNIHIVKSGDSLGKIAVKYGVSIADIKRWNNLKSDKLQVGQKLVIHKK